MPAPLKAMPRHGDLPRWQAALDGLPGLYPSRVELDADLIRIGRPGDCRPAQRAQLRRGLMALHPWRKGPFELFGLSLDAEWRCDCKWRRLIPHVTPLLGRRVLDVGCGNGWYALRMIGAGAGEVIGIEPNPLHLCQHRALRRYLPPLPLELLPLRLEQLPPDLDAFDTVFSMGVISHRRDPMDHLLRLRRLLRPGGELVLEGLVTPGPAPLRLDGRRYARMRNVHLLPSIPLLLEWLGEAGFRDPRCVDRSITTPAEQRSTPWMRFHSLQQALDPVDPSRTVEGYPAPLRALLLARAP